MDRNLLILVAEDSDDDALLLRRAFQKNNINNPVHVCINGADAIAYLQGVGRYADRALFPFPSVIISDLKMPVSDGFDILTWLQDHPDCHVIPVVILSASAEDKERQKSISARCQRLHAKAGEFPRPRHADEKAF